MDNQMIPEVSHPEIENRCCGCDEEQRYADEFLVHAKTLSVKCYADEENEF